METEAIISIIAKLSVKRAELEAMVRKLSRRVSDCSPPLKAIRQELEMVEWDLGNFQRTFAELTQGY